MINIWFFYDFFLELIRMSVRLNDLSMSRLDKKNPQQELEIFLWLFVWMNYSANTSMLKAALTSLWKWTFPV